MLLFLSGTPRILAAKTLCLTGLAIHGHPAFVLEGSIGFSSVTTGAASAIRKLVLYRVVGDLAHEAHHFLYSFLRKRGRKKGLYGALLKTRPVQLALQGIGITCGHSGKENQSHDVKSQST